MFSVTAVRLNGCLFGPPSDRDFRTVFQDRSVPDRVDLRQYCTPVENQGQIGSCTANAAVGALEYHSKRRDGRSPDLSRMFVYFNARHMRGQVAMDTGAQIREAMASVMAFGACREELWPYNPMLFAMEPPPEAYREASLHEAVQYARVKGVQGAIYAVAEGLPVVFGTVIPERCYSEAATTGLLPAPTPDEQNAAALQGGGHAMLIVGYDRTERTFIVRNSWGEEWGERGYCRIPFDVLEGCSKAEDFWVIAELEKATGFQLVRPARTSATPQADGARPGELAKTTANVRDQIRSGLDADLAASNRKIEALLSGGGGPRGVRREQGAATGVLPCTACAGSGICPYCHSRKPGCVRCSGAGTCTECGGAGVL